MKFPNSNGKLQLNLAQKILAIMGLGMLVHVGTVLSQDSALGQFEGHGDIGVVAKPGAVEYDAAKKSYLISGGGENMWFDKDAFHFVWKQASDSVFARTTAMRWRRPFFQMSKSPAQNLKLPASRCWKARWKRLPCLPKR